MLLLLLISFTFKHLGCKRSTALLGAASRACLVLRAVGIWTAKTMEPVPAPIVSAEVDVHEIDWAKVRSVRPVGGKRHGQHLAASPSCAAAIGITQGRNAAAATMVTAAVNAAGKAVRAEAVRAEAVRAEAVRVEAVRTESFPPSVSPTLAQAPAGSIPGHAGSTPAEAVRTESFPPSVSPTLAQAPAGSIPGHAGSTPAEASAAHRADGMEAAYADHDNVALSVLVDVGLELRCEWPEDGRDGIGFFTITGPKR